MDPRIVSVPLKDNNIPHESGGKLLYDRMRSFAKETIALVEVKSNTICTFHDLVTKSTIVATNLRDQLKVAKNDIFAILSDNTQKFWLTALAGLYLAAPFHLINPGYTVYELKNYLMMSKPKIVFCIASSLAKIQVLKDELGFIEKIVLFDDDVKHISGDIICFNDLLKPDKKPKSEFEFEKVEDLEDQVAFICHSSGTTGFPKGAMITHATIRLNFCHASDHSLYPVTYPCSILHVVPVYHVHGFGVSYASLYKGVTAVVMNQFEPKTYLENVQLHKIKKLFIVPSLGDFLANSPLLNEYDVSSVDELYLAAGALKKATEEKLLKRFHLKTLRQVYGLTELGAAVFIVPLEGGKPGSCGKLSHGHQAKIIDPCTGNLLGCNQTGEICIKGAAMKGYINDPEKTRQTIDADGFVRTGDLGYYDEDYFFYIVDRIKDLIKYKSFQVAPAEVEQVLMLYPGVNEAAVVGKPDDRFGELPVAFVVKEDGVKVGEKELQEHVAQYLAVEKRLHGGVRFLEKLPKNEIGKVLRKDLKELL